MVVVPPFDPIWVLALVVFVPSCIGFPVLAYWYLGPPALERLRKYPRTRWLVAPALAVGAPTASILTVFAWIVGGWWLTVLSFAVVWPAVSLQYFRVFWLAAASHGSYRRRFVRRALLVALVVGPLAIAACLVPREAPGAVMAHWARVLRISDTGVAMLVVGAFYVARTANLVVRRWGGSWWTDIRGRWQDPPCFLLLRSETRPLLSDLAGFDEEPFVSVRFPAIRSPGPRGRRGSARVPTSSFRIEVVRALAKEGIPLAVGSLERERDHSLVPIVSIRTSDACWEATVRRLAPQARAIVVIPGTTDGVLTELRLVRSEGWYERCLIFIPPVITRERIALPFDIRVEDNRSAMEGAWNLVRKRLAKDGVCLPPFEPGLVYVPDAALGIRVARRFANGSGSGKEASLRAAIHELLAELPGSRATYRQMRKAMMAPARSDARGG
jgi:hypothetical protein